MSSLEELQKHVSELTTKGLTTDEIARHLNIQRDTVVWLSTHRTLEKTVEKSAMDIYINLSNIQSNTQRLRLLSSLMTHFISQDVKESRITEPDCVVGIELTGIPLSTMVADNLGKSLTIMRHGGRGEKQSKGESWIVNKAFADPAGKRVIIIDDVITSGVTVSEVIRSLRQIRTEVEAVYVIFDKKGSDRIDGVLLRPLVSVLPLKTG
jgi:HTH-type transcriptional regulator, activator of D-glucose/D-fructose catabolism